MIRRLVPGALLVLLAGGTCDEATAVVERTFCVKLYVQGAPSPAACNSRPFSDSFEPTVSITLGRAGPAVSLVLETVLESGEGGVAVVYPPSLPPGIVTAVSSTQVPLPGTATITASATASALVGSGTYRMKYSVEDDLEREVEVVIVIDVT